MFHYVYILKSEIALECHCIGTTSDLEQRLGRDGRKKQVKE
jgi:predicted GIY-YIG superfamily endonuclease